MLSSNKRGLDNGEDIRVLGFFQGSDGREAGMSAASLGLSFFLAGDCLFGDIISCRFRGRNLNELEGKDVEGCHDRGAKRIL